MIAYFDTSSFVKLLVEEPGSQRAAEVWAAADVVVTSMLLYPETRAAIAATLAEVHGLRGCDSVHLASAVEVGSATTVVTNDARLAAAAVTEGFAVLSPS